MRRVAIFAVCVGLFAAPAAAQTKAAMQKLADQWAFAFNTANAAGLAAMYTKDAYLLPNGAPMVKGRAAIEKFWKGPMAALQDVQCTALDVTPLSHSAAFEIGTCSAMTKKPPLQEVDVKFVVVLKKERSTWKLAADIWNTDK